MDRNGTGPIKIKAVAMKMFPMTETIVGYRILSQIYGKTITVIGLAGFKKVLNDTFLYYMRGSR
jgi:hypothetical protein